MATMAVPNDRNPGTVDPDALPRDRPLSGDVATTRILDDDTRQTALFIASTDDPEVAREIPNRSSVFPPSPPPRPGSDVT